MRKICTMTVLILAVMGLALAPSAAAQGTPTCELVYVAEPDPPRPAPTPGPDAGQPTAESAEAFAALNCADAEAYPGPFTNMPVLPTSPYLTPAGITAAPQPVAATEETRSSRDLAHSGTETVVLLYLGTGLLAFGAVALGIRRGAPLED